MASSRPRRGVGSLKSSFALNPEYGYLNSQVGDRDAFKHHLPASAGEETQAELQEPSQSTPTASRFELETPTAEVKPIVVKIEKENKLPTALSPVPKRSLKRVRVEECVAKTEECLTPTPTPTEQAGRISELESEVLALQHQMATNQEAAMRVIDDMRSEWELMRRECIFLRARVGGFGVRLNRVEGHVDEVVEHLPDLHGWRSEVGSNYDPDMILADIEDGSQPVEDDWYDSQVGTEKEVDM
ncbi:hypothetical protein B0H11DRAFT_2263738 [Mycena galericulata]|nr:hypothetical protein B0H11DRAFT_2263738 [Mycena galericulata]